MLTSIIFDTTEITKETIKKFKNEIDFELNLTDILSRSMTISTSSR